MIFTVFKNRNFALLWLGQLLSIIGDWMIYIALPMYVYNLTGSVLATGIMFIAETLPGVLIGSLAGVFVDRWNRKWIMIIADLLRAFILLIILVVRSIEWLWLIYLVAFFEASVSQFFIPAKNAIIPNLVKEKDILPANSLNALSDALTRLIGPSLGGILMGLIGLSGIVILDSISYLISGILIFFISFSSDSFKGQAKRETFIETNVIMENKKPPFSKGGLGRFSTTFKTILKEWLDGLRFVKKERLISSLYIVMGIAMLAQGILNVLFVVFVKDLLEGGAMEFGLLVTTQGLGGIVSGVIIGYLGKMLKPTQLITIGLGAAGLILLAMVNFPSVALSMILTFLVALPFMCYTIGPQTLLQLYVQENYLGRIFGNYGTITALLMLGGMGLASAFGDIIGVAGMLNIAGVFFLFAGLVGFHWWFAGDSVTKK